MTNNERVGYSVLLLCGLAISLGPLAIIDSLFDEAGGGHHPINHALAAMFWALPASCVLGAVLPWLLMRWSWSRRFYLLPLAPLAGILVLAVARPFI